MHAGICTGGRPQGRFLPWWRGGLVSTSAEVGFGVVWAGGGGVLFSRAGEERVAHPELC